MKKEKIGICAICGEKKKLTFEHVLPKSAFNDKPIFIQNFSNLLDDSSKFYGKRMRSNRGFGGYTLCRSCNNNTGDWYARDFADFASQGMKILNHERKSGEMVSFNLDIKPLNVFKEILTMFLSADKSGVLRKKVGMKEFILTKDKKEFPSEISIYMYCSLSAQKKFIGHQYRGNARTNEVFELSEINFEPFGYLLAINSYPTNLQMVNITSFKNWDYNEKMKVSLKMPYLKIAHPIIGLYEK